MSSETSRKNILNKIRLALTKSTPIPFPYSVSEAPHYQPLENDLTQEFAEQFTSLLGKFLFCDDEIKLSLMVNGLCKQMEWQKIYCLETQFANHFPQNLLTDDIITCDAVITSCELLIARTGSIVLSNNNSGRIASAYAPVHICVAYASQIVYDIKDATTFLQEKYGNQLPSFITLATGPSRTADIEKTLVVGVHGPKEVYLILVDDLVY
jgi:L-lactate dehydrogenase complex protein LldG